MIQNDTGLIPLGYYIVRNSGTASKPSWAPSGYVTVAGCLCEGVIPGIESVPIDGEKLARIQALNRFRLTGRNLRESGRNGICLQVKPYGFMMQYMIVVCESTMNNSIIFSIMTFLSEYAVSSLQGGVMC